LKRIIHFRNQGTIPIQGGNEHQWKLLGFQPIEVDTIENPYGKDFIQHVV
jgi:hypothetical protein